MSHEMFQTGLLQHGFIGMYIHYTILSCVHVKMLKIPALRHLLSPSSMKAAVHKNKVLSYITRYLERKEVSKYKSKEKKLPSSMPIANHLDNRPARLRRMLQLQRTPSVLNKPGPRISQNQVLDMLF